MLPPLTIGMQPMPSAETFEALAERAIFHAPSFSSRSSRLSASPSLEARALRDDAVAATSMLTLPIVRIRSGSDLDRDQEGERLDRHAHGDADRRDRGDEARLAGNADRAHRRRRRGGDSERQLHRRQLDPEPVGDVDRDREVHRRPGGAEDRDRHRQDHARGRDRHAELGVGAQHGGQAGERGLGRESERLARGDGAGEAHAARSWRRTRPAARRRARSRRRPRRR